MVPCTSQVNDTEGAIEDSLSHRDIHGGAESPKVAIGPYCGEKWLGQLLYAGPMWFRLPFSPWRGECVGCVECELGEAAVVPWQE